MTTENKPKKKKKVHRCENGEGTVTQRPDGTWQGVLDVHRDENGRRVRKYFYHRTKAGVLEKMHEYQAKLRTSGPTAEPTKLTVSQYLDLWLDNHVRPNLKLGTILNYETAIKLDIKPYFGGMLLRDVTAFQIEDFLGSMSRANRPINAREMAARTLRSALGKAVGTGKPLQHNPWQGVKNMPRPKRRELTIVVPEEARKFLAIAKGHRLWALFHLALASGMREGELFGLQWGDIDWEGSTILVQRSVNLAGELTPTKNFKPRRIALDKQTMAVLREHRKRTLTSGKASLQVFTDTQGGILNRGNFLDRDYKPSRKKAGVTKVRFHDLRHSHASALLTEGIFIQAVQERLGHANIETTLKYYSHLLPTTQREAADKIGEILGSPPRQAAKRAGRQA